MRKLVVLLIAVSAVLSGCVVYDTPYNDGDRGHQRGERDHERDGVRDQQDRHTDNPNRY